MESNQVSSMFSEVVKKYDFLNRILSLGFDKGWRKKLVQAAMLKPGNRVLDIATGTGDVAIEFVRQQRDISVVGVDFSEAMLAAAKNKVGKKGLGEKIEFQYGDALALPFKDNQFDVAVMAFGIRNVVNYKKGIEEIMRVTKVGGKVLILEFSKPHAWIMPFYWLYLHFFIPLLGSLFSKKEAYQYLSNSILQFTKTVDVMGVMRNAGLEKIRQTSMTFGVVSIFSGEKVR